jgi:uncharacterized protein (DUF1810 family)
MPGLERFVRAQEPVYASALAELRAGRKRTHWIWYIFPQLYGLGRSARSLLYGIKSSAEASAYIAHPILGPRLIKCTAAMLTHAGATAFEILGSPDDEKFRSSMTLFRHVPGADSIFAAALEKFFGGVDDPLTLAKLQTPQISPANGELGSA